MKVKWVILLLFNIFRSRYINETEWELMKRGNLRGTGVDLQKVGNLRTISKNCYYFKINC